MEHLAIRSALGTLGNVTAEAEVLRHKAIKARTRSWIFIVLSWLALAGIFFVVSVVMEARNLEIWGVCLGVAGFIGAFLIYIFLTGDKKEAYNSYFMKNILAPVLARCLPGWALYESGGISSQVFNESQLFGTNYNIFKSTALIQGQVAGLDTSCSNLLVQRKTTTYRNGKRRTNTTTLFRGIFLQARLPESLHTDIYMYPDTAEKLFGSLGTKLQATVGEYFAGKGEFAHTGDPDFEKYFVVYCPNPFKATEVLTPERRSVLTEMARENSDLRLCIRQDRMFVGLPCGRDWSVPDVDNACDDIDQLTNILSHPGKLYKLAASFGHA